jgi:hypothetical protein
MTEEMANQFAGEILDDFIPCSAFFRRIKGDIGHALPYAVMQRFKHTHPTLE